MSEKMETSDDESGVPFHEMGLDDRILKSIAKLGWENPTPIQEKAIPLVLEGKDLLARGRTGSGKTGAFAIPAIQKIINAKRSAREQCVRAIFLAPSRELCRQIAVNVKAITSNCSRDVRFVDVAVEDDNIDMFNVLADSPDILIGTPSKVLSHIKAGHLKNLSETLETLVIDEADLVFSFGYEADLKGVLSKLPSIYQAILTSATLSEDVDKLKKLVLHNPVTLKLEEPQLPEASQLTQYQIKIEEEDKFILVYALFKLKLIKGKTIIFVNNVDRCYKIKLYLEQFQIPVCVLNSELPATTRLHIVSQFNQGIYDVIVASDEKFLEMMAPAEAEENSEDKKEKGKKQKVDKDKEKSKRKRDKESGVARGIDFQFVSNVINFDFPLDVDSYIHRVGRTARGNNKGTALSLVAGKEIERLNATEEYLKEQLGEEDDSDDEDESGSRSVFKPYKFKMSELDGFKYRARDAWRAVTKIAVREARLKEIKKEILNSDKLKSGGFFEGKDAAVLRHDKALHVVKHQTHLKSVPDYIVPKSLKRAGFRSNTNSGSGGGRIGKKFQSNKSYAKKQFERRKADPLKSFGK